MQSAYPERNREESIGFRAEGSGFRGLGFRVKGFRGLGFYRRI